MALASRACAVQTARGTWQRLAHDALNVADRTAERVEREARRRPRAAATLAALELIGTALAFGLGPTVVATAASCAAYAALRKRRGRRGSDHA
jgi:hypothetical protein